MLRNDYDLIDELEDRIIAMRRTDLAVLIAIFAVTIYASLWWSLAPSEHTVTSDLISLVSLAIGAVAALPYRKLLRSRERLLCIKAVLVTGLNETNSRCPRGTTHTMWTAVAATNAGPGG